jgi:hypothetical protein
MLGIVAATTMLGIEATTVIARAPAISTSIPEAISKPKHA